MLLLFSGCSGNSTSTSTPKSPAIHNEWTWVSGAETVDQLGVYGTQGAASTSNTPGARVNANSWTDASGNLWLFGGYGGSSVGVQGDLNDLWKYDGSTWTWVSGSNQTEQAGVYGTLGTAVSGSIPGARYQAVSWLDASGNVWILGGLGIDSTGTRGRLGDLWKYSNGQWTWMSGSNLSSQPGVNGGYTQSTMYGTLGVAAAGNTPGIRTSASSWTDSAGNLWLFGGLGIDSTGTFGYLNDLWKYSGNQWTWMSGASAANQLGTYGTMGSTAPNNVPGARVSATTWTDTAGNLWLFGGEGYDATGKGTGCATPPYVCELNDLWKYNGSEWAWMGGANTTNQSGTYGTIGVAASSNIPGARDNATGWIDAHGVFWLFGGFGFDSAGTSGDLNDLWKYSGGQWTWVNGEDISAQTGNYGTLGTAATSNLPACRDGAVSWIDKSNNLWLFGGGDYLTIAHGGKFNDLWEYQP